jgi:pilus assembly protein CpaC
MRIADWIVPAAVVAAMCGGAPRAGAWQTAALSVTVRDINLIEGRGELLRFQNDIARVVAAEPKIADAIVVSPREVMVTAKGPGRTTVVVWENGGEPVRYEVDVEKDMADWENFRKMIAENAAGDPVTVTGTGETIVLTGAVKSVEQSKRLAGMAQARAKTVVNLLTTPPAAEPRQILLQVKFAAVNRVALTQVGFNLFSLNDKFAGATSTQQFAPPRFGQLQTTGGQVTNNTVSFSDLLNLFAFRPDLNIGATIKALQERNLLQILAEPNLIVLEGKDASFLAGGSFPFPTITTTPTGGATAPVVTVQFKPFGVKLDFSPTVTAQGAIDLKVAPEVSALDFTNAVTLEGFTIPALSQRRAETEIVLRDGESFAIAGLIDNRVIETIDKVPGLANLPILGRLFQSRSTQKSNDELLVVVTPHFVRPLSAEEKAKLPDMPATFLPTAVDEKAKKSKGKSTASSGAGTQPEFVGPRGQQIPKQ